MSWQDYVDNQLIASQCVSKACIAGHDGGVWAKSEGFDVSILRNFFSFLFIFTKIQSTGSHFSLKIKSSFNQTASNFHQ